MIPRRGSSVRVYSGPVTRNTGREEGIAMSEERKRSFWSRLFNLDYHSAREERVVEYIIHRLREGAGLQEVIQEEYVRRNASPAEIEEICSRPELVQAAREHMEQDFSSGEIDPHQRPG
jgi:hypothetical protein